MKKLIVVFLLIAVTASAGTPLNLSSHSNKKLMSLVKDSFESGYTLTCLTLSDNLQKGLAKPMPDGSLYQVKKEGGTVGYAYVSRAKGRSETFDYAVIFDGNLSTRQVKVLDYRSPHGEAITGRSWLKQFANKTIDYLFEYHKNVDSMSGATISATSIIEDVNLVKKNMVVLKRMGAL